MTNRTYPSQRGGRAGRAAIRGFPVQRGAPGRAEHATMRNHSQRSIAPFRHAAWGDCRNGRQRAGGRERS
jgi:hypothetical protein